MSSPLGRPPRNREIVSFRACERRAVSGCEDNSKCKTKAYVREPFPFALSGRERGLPFSLWESYFLFPVRSSEFK